MDNSYTLVLFLLVAGCAAPCELATVLSAYEAENQSCVRISDTREKAENCILEVQQRYLPKFQKLGEDAIKEMRDVR